MINQEIKVGKPKKVGDRVFYPILKIFHWKHNHSQSYSVSPIALVVTENEMKYVFPLEEFDCEDELQDLMDMVSPENL